MIWAVGAEAIAIGVLALLVLALAHAYAGLASRVTSGSEDEPGARTSAVAARAVTPETEGALRALDGVTLGGETVHIPLSGVPHDTLVAFLSSSCATCRPLWAGLHAGSPASLPSAVRVLVVAKGLDSESPAELARLAPPGCDLVCSSEAWVEFAVPGSPYFALVDGPTGRTVGEGTAIAWPQVASLLELSTRDAAWSTGGARAHEVEVDRVLRDAGILPGDPSLYPTPARPPG